MALRGGKDKDQSGAMVLKLVTGVNSRRLPTTTYGKGKERKKGFTHWEP